MLIIATSGGQKSPGFDAAMLPVRKRQQRAKRRFDEALKSYETELEEYKQKLKEWKDSGAGDARPEQPERPTWERCWTDDTTIEALARLLMQNPRGLLLSSDELSGWFGSFDRYAKAGTKTSADVPKWLHIHGGRAMIIDRKTGEPPTISVPLATVSIAGCIQPGVLRRVLSREHHENGMAARFLFAMPPKRQKKWSEAEIHEELEAAVRAVFDRLFDFEADRDEDGEPIPRFLELSTVAKRDFWIPFYNEHAKELMEMDDDLSATWSKLEGYAARLALVHFLIRVAANAPSVTDPDTVDQISMAAGIALSRWFGQEAKRVFAMLGEGEEDQANRELVEQIERLGGTVTPRELQRSSRKYQKAEDAENALQKLVEQRKGDWRSRPSSGQGGRPTRVFVHVRRRHNPRESQGKWGFCQRQRRTRSQRLGGRMIVLSPEAAKLLADLADLGIDLQLQGDMIRFRPRSAMTPALLQRLQALKAELLSFLDTEAVVAELRQSIASLWNDPAWKTAWERRFPAGKYANFASLQRVLNSIIDRAAEHHRRHEWDAFASAWDLLFSIASGEIWDRAELTRAQFPLDLTDLEQIW